MIPALIATTATHLPKAPLDRFHILHNLLGRGAVAGRLTPYQYGRVFLWFTGYHVPNETQILLFAGNMPTIIKMQRLIESRILVSIPIRALGQG